MASRRMFAKSVIQSARFLRLPQSVRLLYYDLGMAADDEGVVEAFTVMLTSGATEDDLKTLADKGFVTVLNEDLVSHITDWATNNYIQSDRFHQSIYHDLIPKTDTACIHGVSKMDTEVRLELDKSKDNLDQGKEDKERAGRSQEGGRTSALRPLPDDKDAEFERKRDERIRDFERACGG